MEQATTVTAPKLVAPKEAAGYLGVSEKWLERDRWAGAKIPYVKIGRHVRYRMSDLVRFVDENTEGAA
ncbi:MAG: helix-turn-helix domain-containing protein [Roseicyclus sp.]